MAPTVEVYENTRRPSAELIAYRDPIAGVIAWFESLGVRRNA
jgi:hypothetical protein